MANQTPLTSAYAVSAGGNTIVPEVLREALLSKVNRIAAALKLSPITRINSNRASWPVYLGRPTAAFVGEGAAKPVTGAEFTALTVNIKKLATFVVYTEELLEDARFDPQVLVNDDVQKAFADLIDQNMIGTHPGGTSTQATFDTNFDAALASTTNSVELGTGADAYALAISAAMEVIESNGYTPNGMLASFDSKRQLRDARDGFGRSLYRADFSGDVESLEGMNLAWSTNLDGFPAGLMGGAGSPGKVVGIVGDFSSCSKPVIRNDMRTDTFREATVGAHNLAEQNKLAVRWEMRMGYQVFEPNRGFCKIINAA